MHAAHAAALTLHSNVPPGLAAENVNVALVELVMRGIVPPIAVTGGRVSAPRA